MNQERNEQVLNVLREHREKIQKNGEIAPLIGSHMDPALKEDIGYTMFGVERDSETVKKLESLGFKAIYPAELSEEAISRMSDVDKYVYEDKMKRALIIDGKETNLSLEFAKMISDHYLSADITSTHFWGLDRTNNSITKYIGLGHHKEGTAENLQSLLSSVGFNPTLDGEKYDKSITISSDIPYPAVKRTKFEQIYDKGKGKIQGMFAKLKSIVKPKNQIKENEQDERE